MSRHSDAVRLRHMLSHAEEAAAMAQGRKREDLDRDRQLNLSLTHLLGVCGEAAAHISLETRKNHQEIPWGQLIGLRNRLIHGYDEVDFDILWDIVQLDLPPLILALRRIFGEQEGRSFSGS